MNEDLSNLFDELKKEDNNETKEWIIEGIKNSMDNKINRKENIDDFIDEVIKKTKDIDTSFIIKIYKILENKILSSDLENKNEKINKIADLYYNIIEILNKKKYDFRYVNDFAIKLNLNTSCEKIIDIMTKIGLKIQFSDNKFIDMLDKEWDSINTFQLIHLLFSNNKYSNNDINKFNNEILISFRNYDKSDEYLNEILVNSKENTEKKNLNDLTFNEIFKILLYMFK